MGWAEGLQSGLALGNTIRQGFERRELADEAKKYQITEGAYGDMSTQLEALDAGARQNIQAMQAQGASEEQIAATRSAYDQAAQELTRRQGLTAPDYSVGSGGYDGGKNYGTLKEAETAASPLRTQGLANVYRAQGNVEKADELEARALQNRAAGLQVNKLQRDEDTDVKIQGIDKQAGDFLAKRLTNEDGSMRAATTDDMIAQIQHRATLLQKGGLGREAVNALKDWQGVAVNAIQLTTAQRNEDLGRTVAALGQGDLKPAQAFYDKYVMDGAKTTGIVQNKDGSLTVSRVRDDGVKLPDTKVASIDALGATLRSFNDPKALYDFSQNEFKNNLQVRQVAASEKSANATAALSNERLTNLKDERENRSKAADIAAEYEGLTDIEKAGPKGQGLVRQFNMTNAKIGGQVSLGAQDRPGQKMTDIEKENLRAYRDWEKDDRNQRLPQAEKDAKATQMGVYNFVNPTANVVQSGLGSNPYGNPDASKGNKADAGKQQGIQTQAPKLNSMNTRILSKAGRMGYNVELPDGSTRVYEKDELEDMGYKFPSR